MISGKKYEITANKIQIRKSAMPEILIAAFSEDSGNGTEYNAPDLKKLESLG